MASLTILRSPAVPERTELYRYSRPESPAPEEYTPPSICAAVQSRGYTRLTSGMLVTPLMWLAAELERQDRLGGRRRDLVRHDDITGVRLGDSREDLEHGHVQQRRHRLRHDHRLGAPDQIWIGDDTSTPTPIAPTAPRCDP